MADALCGPSNALQNFQKHSTVDRSLQQDRLGPRLSPAQGFRSSPSPNALNLDAEFQAFQTGNALGGAPTPLHHGPLPQFTRAPQPQSPSWASDFQRMSLHDARMSPMSGQFRHEVPLHRSSPVSGWHQEFMRQPAQNTIQSPTSSSSFSGMSSQFPMQPFSPMTTTSNYTSQIPFQQTQQVPQQAADLFDEAAFARAFDAAQEQSEQQYSTKGKEKAQERNPLTFNMDHACTEPGDVLGNYDHETSTSVDDAFDWEAFLKDSPMYPDIATELEVMKRDGGWEALDTYERALEQEVQETNSQRSRDIVDRIRNMRTEDELHHTHLEDLVPKPIGADTIQPDAEQDMKPDAEADALSRTAGQLLDNLKDEQSQKFQQSNFMELMRQLRDKEIKVEGDKMVSVSVQSVHPGVESLSHSNVHADPWFRLT